MGEAGRSAGSAGSGGHSGVARAARAGKEAGPAVARAVFGRGGTARYPAALRRILVRPPFIVLPPQVFALEGTDCPSQHLWNPLHCSS